MPSQAACWSSSAESSRARWWRGCWGWGHAESPRGLQVVRGLVVIGAAVLLWGRVTVAGKPSDDLAPGTLRSIEKQSGVPLR